MSSAFGVDHDIEKALRNPFKRNTTPQPYSAKHGFGRPSPGTDQPTNYVPQHGARPAPGTKVAAPKVVKPRPIPGPGNVAAAEDAARMGSKISRGKAGAIVGGIGAATLGAGYLMGRHKEKVGKADRRFKSETAQWTGHLPKHTPGAVAARQAGAGFPKPLPKAVAIRNTLRATKLAKNQGEEMLVSEFGVIHDFDGEVLSKAMDLPEAAKVTGGFVRRATTGATDAFKGAKVGASGRSFGHAPGTTPGMLGAKVGRVGRTGYKSPAFKPAAIGAGAGAVGAGGAAVAHKDRKKY